ncbi:MAG: peptidoglycan editing factor PgeF [Gammaproteobacteria bacterium]
MDNTANNDWIVPDWPAPANVRACSTYRFGGISKPPFGTLNLADHVGDDSTNVRVNRQKLVDRLQLPETPRWLSQYHSDVVVNAEDSSGLAEADASFTSSRNVVCAVLTADCLPVLVCNKSGTRVAAIHAGWRGLYAGIIENTIQALAIAPEETLVWLGPAIGPTAYEVGREVYHHFVDNNVNASRAFEASRPGHWFANLYELARIELRATGIQNVWGGNHCTYTESQCFFSYRREGVTGRMATIIWFD